MAGRRVILLVDMNAFFASVHQAVDPALKDKPVIVCGDPAKRHGIVLTASYPARPYGIRTGMTVGEARAFCPQGIFVQPDYELYMDFSLRAVQVMRDYSPLVEVFSIDEAFIDVTGCERLFGDGVAIARKIMERINGEIGIGCSIGVGNSKVVAKTAADLRKPHGLTTIWQEEIPGKYWPLPVEKMFGVGSRTRQALNDFFAVYTIGELAGCDVKRLKRRFGVVGEVLWVCAHGEDNSPVDPHSLEEAKSIGHQITLPRDYYRRSEMYTVLLELSDDVCQRARAKGYRGRVVGLAVRGKDLSGLYRVKTLWQYTNLASDVFAAAASLLEEHWPGGEPVRLLGVTLAQLCRTGCSQVEAFTSRGKEEKLAAALDAIQKKHGKRSLMRAVSLTEGSLYHEPGEQTVGGAPDHPARVPDPGRTGRGGTPSPARPGGAAGH